MPKLKSLSGAEVISIFKKWGFSVHSQRGSHVKLIRVVNKARQTLTIPKHKKIDRGTLTAIIRQAGRFIYLEELNKAFENN